MSFDSMINIAMDGREIEILKKLLSDATDAETSKFKIAEYNLLYEKLEKHRELHHTRHANEIMKRFK